MKRMELTACMRGWGITISYEWQHSFFALGFMNYEKRILGFQDI